MTLKEKCQVAWLEHAESIREMTREISGHGESETLQEIFKLMFELGYSSAVLSSLEDAKKWRI